MQKVSQGPLRHGGTKLNIKNRSKRAEQKLKSLQQKSDYAYTQAQLQQEQSPYAKTLRGVQAATSVNARFDPSNPNLYTSNSNISGANSLSTVEGEVEEKRGVYQQIGHHMKNQYVAVLQCIGLFITLAMLFFLKTAGNVLLDSTKDGFLLMSSSVGGQVLPYIYCYFVFPMSIVMVGIYWHLSKRYGRKKTFNILCMSFATIFIGYAMFILPNVEVLQLNYVADILLTLLPTGCAGFVDLIRHWHVVLYYVLSEMFGDVLISLLFWQLANSKTGKTLAPKIYPLYGLIGNVAQSICGFLLRGWLIDSGVAYTVVMQKVISVVVCILGLVLVIHNYASDKFPDVEDLTPVRQPEPAPTENHRCEPIPDIPPPQPLYSGTLPPNYCEALSSYDEDVELIDTIPSNPRWRVAVRKVRQVPVVRAMILSVVQNNMYRAAREVGRNAVIRNLALMSAGTGLTASTTEFVWKTYTRSYFDTSSQYSSFMAQCASMCGMITIVFMMFGSVLFVMLGWGKTASITPLTTRVLGGLFLITCVLFELARIGLIPIFPEWIALNINLLLYCIVVLGAVLWAVCRAAKFALLKPSEELAYTGQPKFVREKGKAVVDLLGMQFGKCTGHMLNQCFLVVSGGNMLAVIFFIGVTFFTTSFVWTWAIRQLQDTVERNMEAAKEMEVSMNKAILADQMQQAQQSELKLLYEGSPSDGWSDAQDSSQNGSSNGMASDDVSIAGFDSSRGEAAALDVASTVATVTVAKSDQVASECDVEQLASSASSREKLTK